MKNLLVGTSHMKKNFLLVLISLFFSFSAHAVHLDRSGKKTYHYYCTSADEKHYPLLKNLIASIHKIDYKNLDEIAVFNLGLNSFQLNELKNIKKVKVYEVEKTHPDILTYFHTGAGKQVRGWYAWKPVAMKQGLDMFPYFLYLDSGSLVLTSPDNLFKHIKQNGYFIISVGHNIVDRITTPVLEKIVYKLPQHQQDLVLNPNTINTAGGVQGLSREVFSSYIKPIYNLSSDLSVFMDDGSATLGFGAARHDQTLFSIYTNILGFKVHNGDGWSDLKVDGKNVPFHYVGNRPGVNEHTCIYSCRLETSLAQDILPYIHWKKKKKNK